MESPRPRKIRDAADAARCLNRVDVSGLTLSDWAHRHQVDARSLNMWRVITTRGRPKPTALRLVELVAAEPAPPPPREARYRVEVGELVVELDARFDEDVLVRLLRAVRAC